MEVFLLVASFAVILAGALLFTNAIEWIGHKLVLGPGPMPLVFNGFEIAAIFLGVLVAYQVTNEGESTWFEGVQLLALYAIIGLTFYFA